MTDTQPRAENDPRLVRTGIVDPEPRLLIDGEWVPARGGQTMDTTDPATGRRLAAFASGTREDVDAAVRSARRAQPGWGRLVPAQRARVLLAVAAGIRDRSEALARVESLDTGKPLRQARADVEVAARYFEYYAGLADKLLGSSIPIGPDFIDYTVREPVGVSGQIASWNYPLQIGGRGIAPALAAGNAVVVKPAEESPLSLLALGRLLIEVGIPPGVVNVVTGPGEEVGAAVAGHPGVDQVTFTGSVGVGTLVMQAAARNVSPVTLELGGKCPSVICEDADLDAAVPILTRAIVQNAGQSCSGSSLIVCARARHDEVVERLAATLRSTRLGAGIDDPEMGPLISARQLTRVGSMVGRALDAGATAVTGGAPASDEALRGGFFYQPTLVAGAGPGMEIAREEVFGPVMTVLAFDDDDHAVALSNDSGFGLVSSVWTRDLSRAHRLARDIRTGQVYVNTYGAGGAAELPFGGFGKSGFGREKGAEGLNSYLATKNVCVRL